MGNAVTLRFFAIDRAAYDTMRPQLDAAIGLPNQGQVTALPPSNDSPINAAGRVMLSTRADWFEMEPLEGMLSDMVAGGLCEEISQRQYEAAVLPAGE